MENANNPTSGKSQNARTKGTAVAVTDTMEKYLFCIYQCVCVWEACASILVAFFTALTRFLTRIAHGRLLASQCESTVHHSSAGILSITAVQASCPSQPCRHPVLHSSAGILSITAVQASCPSQPCRHPVYHSNAGMAAESLGSQSCYICTKCSVHILLLYLAGDPAHGILLLAFRVDLSFSVRPF